MFHRLILVLVLIAFALPAAGAETPLLTNIRQITFEGRRTGEGYFSADGSAMIFQSERHPGNPFYQMYLMDMVSGDVRLVSPGHGKTTCGWVHPDGSRVMFSSTHGDPDSLAKQKAELDFRASGKKRRYSWDYDENYEIYEVDLESQATVKLTNAPGYDAEGSYSPDGTLIAFASNRDAYSRELSAEESKIFERDKSHFMDIYVMNADGSDIRRLTDAPGYDGGPFFSADGTKIVWRRFAENGATAEVFTMNVDGSEPKQITQLGVMSWAPFFHPSGDYMVFATNLHGMANFELYAVDSQGLKAPVRVTDSAGFDGLAAFSPDGNRLAWSSKRSSDKTSQIFIADWNDNQIRQRLGLGNGEKAASSFIDLTKSRISPADMRLHVAYLATETMGGRLTGSDGERMAADYVANAFRDLGLEPASGDGFLQTFDFTAGASLGKDNRLTLESSEGETTFGADKTWRPLAFSRAGQIEPAEVAFAGYGIVTPSSQGEGSYDSYADLDVTGKWALILRHLPEDISAKQRKALVRYSDLQYKAAAARRKGAVGVIVASGPNSGVKDQLVRLSFESAGGLSGGAAVSITNQVTQALLSVAGKDLKQLQDSLDGGEAAPGFLLPGVKVAANIDIVYEKRKGANVLGRLKSGAPGGASGTAPAVIIGAHLDHLGHGEVSSSLARGDEKGKVHYGADDNASGVAGLLEIAQHLSALKKSGRLKAKRDIVFAAWSGEELGLLGSKHYTKIVSDAGGNDKNIQSAVAAYLNMDMIGRLEENLFLQGVGSSPVWRREIERRNVPVGLSVAVSTDSYLPTDSTSFYLKGVPVLTAFTGAHTDYHTPRDTPDKLNYKGAAKVARLMANIALSLARSESVPQYVKTERPKGSIGRKNIRVYLGTIPDYAQEGVKGIKISGTAKGGPAEKAGLKGGDVIVGLAGIDVANIYEFVDALGGLKAGKEAEVAVMRDGERVTLTVIPQAKE